jgi:polysaccharide biosynthesis/export protein
MMVFMLLGQRCFGRVTLVRPLVLSLTLAGAALAAPVIARAESAPMTTSGYPLAPGDVLHIEFLAQPDYGRDLLIEVDGKADLPLIGPVRVAGRTIAELRAEVPVLLSGAVIRERAGNAEHLIQVRPEEVSLSVAKYRPVYVDGAVRDPGEIDFEVGMTLRQALAKARGIGIPTTRSATLDAVSEAALLSQLGLLVADKAVTEALLAGADSIDATPLMKLPLDPGRRDVLITRANARLAAESKVRVVGQRGGALKLQSVEDGIVDALRQKESLIRIALNEEDNVKRIEGLARRGAASEDALTASKRAWLQALDRVDAAQSDAVAAQERRRELEQKSAELTLREQSDLLVKLNAQDSDELALRDKLAYLLGPDAGGTAAVPGLVIYRQGAALDALYDTPLMPADVIAVQRGEMQ